MNREWQRAWIVLLLRLMAKSLQCKIEISDLINLCIYGWGIFFPGIIFWCMLSHPQIGLTIARCWNPAGAVSSHKRRGLWSREFGTTVRSRGSSSGDATPEQCQRWRVTTSDNVPWDLGVRGRVLLAPRFLALCLWAVRGKSWERGRSDETNATVKTLVKFLGHSD